MKPTKKLRTRKDVVRVVPVRLYVDEPLLAELDRFKDNYGMQRADAFRLICRAGLAALDTDTERVNRIRLMLQITKEGNTQCLLPLKAAS